MSTPFKMKGSPMQRNFGISPVKQTLPTKTLKGTTVFGKEVNKKNIIRGIQAIGTRGISEAVREVAKTDTGKKVIKRVKRAGKNINDALKNDILLKGIKKLIK